jgi:hypothetical protein
MVGMGRVVIQDLPPYCVYVGTGPRRLRLNSVGLSRNGFDEGTVRLLEQWVESGRGELPDIAAVQGDIARYKALSGRR